MNYMEKAFEPAERIYRRTVMHDTFGHLRPNAKTVYTGHIYFTHACNGDITIIDYCFRDASGRELDSSPWLWEHMNEYVGEKILPRCSVTSKLPEGHVYKFTGKYTMKEDRETDGCFIEGGGVIKGRIKRIDLR